MCTAKPLIFTSYARADEPEKTRGEEIPWLNFVVKFLRPTLGASGPACSDRSGLRSHDYSLIGLRFLLRWFNRL